MYNHIYITKERAVQIAKWLRREAQTLYKHTFYLTFDYSVLTPMTEEEYDLFNKFDEISAVLWSETGKFCTEIDKIIERLEEINKRKGS